ncbi:MAG TPA: DUF11 domain-containing protein, partial [Candidatus Polarisedimenticolia bacterium]|nr:DUF11 domain-containing protein [Candidatus Polarisedimenticolia bacterium]
MKRAGSILALLIVGVVGLRLAFAAPTLTTITIDGSMADWAAVLANPENVVLDGPGGGLADADPAVPANLDLNKIAYTWDATYLYFYVSRQASAPEFNYFWFHLDLNNDGRVPNNAPLLKLGWWGNNRRTDTSLEIYKAANVAAGDAITNALGKHDGYKLPGTKSPGIAIESLNGGTASGLEAETRVAWAALGVPAGTAFQFHLSATRRDNDYPGVIKDNAGAKVAFAGVDLAPDRSVTAPPAAQAVMAHTVTNTGNLNDVFDMTWSSTGPFAPTSVVFYRDVDASGTLTAGDLPLVDTDFDGTVDTGMIAAFGGVLRILAVAAIPGTATTGQVCVITLRARSSATITVFDTAVDTVTVMTPAVTLLKSVDKATAPPLDVLTYTIIYTNTGGANALAVEVKDPVPASTTYVAGSASGAGMTITFSHDGGASFNGSDALPVTHVRW